MGIGACLRFHGTATLPFRGRVPSCLSHQQTLMSFSRRQTLAALGALPFASALSACGGGDQLDTPEIRVTHDGLNGSVILRLRQVGGSLIAATEDGLFQRSGGRWQARGLAGMVVLDATAIADSRAINGQRWMASIRDAAGRARLVESLNEGQSWTDVANDFGGVNGSEAIQALVYDSAGARLLATGTDVLATSPDGGRSWLPMVGQWDSFGQPKRALAINPRTTDVWFGGQNSFEELTLYVLKAGANIPEQFNNLMPAPSVAKAIRFAPDNPRRVLVAGEGGIVQTLNGGTSWQRLFADDHNFYFDVLQDPTRSNRWVTARWLKNWDQPQRLHLRISEDDGATWQSVEFNEPNLFGGTWAMAAAVEEGTSVFYLGLYRGGIVRVQVL